MHYALILSLLMNTSGSEVINNDTNKVVKNKIENYQVLTISQSGSLFYSVTNQILESVKNLNTNITFIGRANVGLDSITRDNDLILQSRNDYLYNLSVKTVESSSANLFYKKAIVDTLKVDKAVVSSLTAERYRLKIGDKFLFVNNKEIKNWNQLVNIIKVNPEKYIKLNIQRDNKILELSVKPARVNGEDGFYGRLGISPLTDEKIIKRNTIEIQHSFFESIKLSAIKTYDFTLLTFNFIGKLIKGEASAKNISGPVGIANYAADSFDNGFTSFLSLLAMLSISIGILNLLPIPMLDGGHLMYYLVEFVVRRPIPEKAQLVFQQIGMTFLILLSFFALYNDLLRIM